MGVLTQSFIANAQYAQVDVGIQSIGISFDSHRFRGWNAALLLAKQDEQQHQYIAFGPTIKSWLFGSRQNVYVSAGLRLYHADIGNARSTGGTVRNVLRYEPTSWQSLQLRADLEYAPSAARWLSLIQADFSVSEELDLILGWRHLHFHTEEVNRAEGYRGPFIGLGSVW